MGAVTLPSAPPVSLEGSVAVTQMRRITLALVWLVVFTVPSSSGLLLAASVGTLSRLVGALALAAGLATLVVGGRRYAVLDVHVLMVLFVLWAYVSTLWSIAPALTAIDRWTAVQLLVLALLIWEFARRPDQWRRLMWAYLLGSYLGAFGVFQAVLSGAAFGTGRFSGPGFNPGSQAHIMLIALPLAWYLGLVARSRGPRLVARAFVPLGSLAILLTASRASLLILPMALAIIPLTHGSSVPIGRPRRTRTPAASWGVLVLGAVLVAAAVVAVLPAATTNRLSTVQSELTGGDLSGRSPLWTASLEAIQQQQFIGVGAGASRRVLLDAVGDLKGTHNSYLAVATELGVVGFTIFLLLLLGALARARRHAPLERVLGLTLLAVLVASMVPSHSHMLKSTWIALAFVVAPTRMVVQTHDGEVS